jgi:spermidine synthase
MRRSVPLENKRARWPARALIPILAGSGFAGLGYEIVWTRMLSLALGTEMMAVLGVVAGFFGGLALGAFVLDGPIRRARSPRAAYAVLEAVIGVWGAISVVLLPAAGRALPPLLATHPAPALLWAAGFALPALVLLPATTAMGGTLAALDRMMALAGGNARVTAGVYGGNTAGAVLGTLAAAFVLLPAFGLSGSLIALACLNGVCALAALAFGPRPAPEKPAPETPASPPIPGAPKRKTRMAITLFATGLLGVAFEVVVVRLAAQLLQDTIYSFAALLAAYMTGTAAGGILWQYAGPRIREAGPTWLLAATCMACLCTAWSTPFIVLMTQATSFWGVAGELTVAAALLLLPSAAMGALFSHLAQSVRDENGSPGWAVGVNSMGAAVAPAVASLLLIPAFGTWAALLPLGLGYLALVPWRRAAIGWCAAPALLGIFLILHPALSLIRVPEGGALIAVREGPMATASVVDDASGARYLEVNGHFRMGGTSSKRSDYRQALVPMLLHDAPHDALFLGIGTGATLVGGALMPGVAVQGVELSPEVAALLPDFADPHAGKPPPVTVADARRYVVADHHLHDVVIADLYHPALDGSGALYTTEHFTAIRNILAPGGVFCQWLPLYQLDLPSLRTILRSFLAVYPHGSAWLNHYSVATPMLALIGGRGPVRVDPAALAARLARPDMAEVLGPLGLTQPIDLLGQFVAGPTALAAFAGNGPLNTDDFPAVALDAQRNVRALAAPRAALLLTLVGAVQGDAHEMLAAGADPAWTARLKSYWQARNRFLLAGASLHGTPRGVALVDEASPGLLDTIRISADFDPAYQPLLSMARMLAEGDREAAGRLLHQIDGAAPSRPEARSMMAALRLP